MCAFSVIEGWRASTWWPEYFRRSFETPPLTSISTSTQCLSTTNRLFCSVIFYSRFFSSVIRRNSNEFRSAILEKGDHFLWSTEVGQNLIIRKINTPAYRGITWEICISWKLYDESINYCTFTIREYYFVHRNAYCLHIFILMSLLLIKWSLWLFGKISFLSEFSFSIPSGVGNLKHKRVKTKDSSVQKNWK